ncbi:hypothetical protein Xoosp13_191 [Xanthomonas phage Xoo-sp13]|nr:hypothetical protein Xoosp13_191 [Xanthomonas phage Xoo-sp13]
MKTKSNSSTVCNVSFGVANAADDASNRAKVIASFMTTNSQVDVPVHRTAL